MEIKKDRRIKVAIIGLGLIGKERLRAIGKLIAEDYPIQLIGVYDPFADQNKFQNILFFDNISDLIDSKPDWVIVATPHEEGFIICKELLQHSIKVLLEKPFGRNLKEAEILHQSQLFKNQIYVGLNYRFYDGVKELIQLIEKKYFGRIISINISLGHGCNPDILKTWKLDPVKAGGGALIDPGIHIIDLARIFLSNKLIEKSFLASFSGFWKTGIEEEVNFILTTDETILNANVSIVRWQSQFQIQVNGEDNYAILTGRNRSYGDQKLIVGKRWGWLNSEKSQKETEELIVTSSGENTFYDEIKMLFFGVHSKNFTVQPCNADEALLNMQIYDKLSILIKK